MTQNVEAIYDKRAVEIVQDKAQTNFSDLWRKEDYWAIWLGFLLLLIGSIMFLPNKPKGMEETFARSNAIMELEAQRAPFKTIDYYAAQDAKESIRARDQPFAKKISAFLSTPKSWKSDFTDSFYMSEEKALALNEANAEKYAFAQAATAEALAAAKAAEILAEQSGFADASLNQDAQNKIDDWRKAKHAESSAKRGVSNKPYNIIPSLLGVMIVMGLFFSIGTSFMEDSSKKFLIGFVGVFTIAVLSYFLAGQATMKHYGIGYAAWAIAIGMIIANTVGTPDWIKPALKVEFFIKTGLVLLGAEVLFNKIVAIGTPGIFVTWVVTPIVLVSTYLFGQKVLKMKSKTLNMVISADMSVCGTSAAIAAASACKAKKEELTLAIGLSLIFTSIMMIVMPAIIKATGMPHILGGAWMGGTIDATGAVAAAGAFLSEKALYVAATIKMIQNVLIGAMALAIAIYWSVKVDATGGQRVTAMDIWHRFPKFVLGFLAASIIFSFLYGRMGHDAGFTMIDNGVLRGFTRIFRDWFFCLSFVAIGMATNFRELAHHFKGGKPLILYVCGQSLNLILTLTMAYIMFYLVFPHITASI